MQQKNICGNKIKKYRLQKGLSIRGMTIQLQIYGLDIGKSAYQEIEAGKRWVRDYEIKILAEAFGCTYQDLLD